MLTYDASNNEYKTYKNNSLHRSGTATGTIQAQSNGEAFYIGTRGWGGNDEKADMWIDDFSIWRGRVLDSNDVSALYNGGSGIVATDLSDQTGLYWYNSFDGDGSEVKNEGLPAPTNTGASPNTVSTDSKVGVGSFVSPQIQVTAKALTSPGAVSIASNAFSPTPLTVTTGSTVTWTNNESAGSQTTTYLDEDFSSDNWSHDGNQVSSGGLDFTFNRSGTTHKSTYDLGQVVGDFTMRFDFTPSSFTQGGDCLLYTSPSPRD